MLEYSPYSDLFLKCPPKNIRPIKHRPNASKNVMARSLNISTISQFHKSLRNKASKAYTQKNIKMAIGSTAINAITLSAKDSLLITYHQKKVCIYIIPIFDTNTTLK